MPYKIKRSDELYHTGIEGMKWGIRRYQNKDGTLTEEGKKRYRNDAAGYTNAVKDSDKYPKASLSKHVYENTGLVNAASSFTEERKALHDATERERKEYSKLFANKKLLSKMSEQAYKEFFEPRASEVSISDEDKKKDKEYWDSVVKYASEHNGQIRDDYVTDSILDVYYRSSEGKAYQKAVNDYVDAAVTAKRKADKLAKEYLQDHFDEPVDRNRKNYTVGRDFTDRMLNLARETAWNKKENWDDPRGMIPDQLAVTLTEEQRQAMLWLM